MSAVQLVAVMMARLVVVYMAMNMMSIVMDTMTSTRVNPCRRPLRFPCLPIII